MNKNFNLIAKELFGKIRTQFPSIKLGDNQGKTTSVPEDARFLNFDYSREGTDLGSITVNLSEEDGLVVIYSNDIVEGQSEFIKNQFFDFVKELREFAKQKFLNFDTRDITKSNLETRDYQFLSKKNNGDTKMAESKLFGTSKTSYQQMGDSKIILKHSAPVNIENPAGRTQRIDSIYIENIQGERFRYPYKHLNGARALAQHINHGGTPYDAIGQHVISLSEELSKLRMFKNYVERNPMVAENMNSVNTKVLERIDSVKKEIHDLQNSLKYEQFVESFEEPTEINIPEDVMNDWIDRLTIRTFNEELKNVFPYIFKIVGENDIPIKEVSVDDLVKEEKCKACGMDPCDCDGHKKESIKELEAYERFLNQIIERTDIFSDEPESQDAAVEKLNKLIAEPFPVGIDGNNAIESLSDIIDDEELMDIFKELADVSPDSDVRDVLRDYIKMKDEENGTDVLSKLNFEAEPAEPEAEPAEPEAEPAAAEPAPAAEPATEPAPGEEPVTAGLELEGNAFADAVRKAKAAGMKPGDKFKVGEKEFTLQDAIEMAGFTVEDFFGNKQQSETNDLIEFVRSMFDHTTGGFPKGETGVLIACEKKFGEGVLPVAKKVIEKLQVMSEMTRMKKLAGLH